MSDDSAMLKRLADIEAIKQLKARYFRFLDTKQWHELQKQFAPDARFNIAGSRSQPTTVDEFINSVGTHLKEAVTIHHGHMPEIEVDDGFHARGIWAMYDLVEMPPASDRLSFRGFGHYHEEYSKIDGSWVISSLQLTRLRVDSWPAGQAPPTTT